MAQYSRKLSKGIRWWYKFDFKGTTYNSDCIYLSKNEARRAENLKYEEVSNLVQNSLEKRDFSLLQIINDRLDWIKIKKSENYYKENKRYLSILVNHFGDVSIESISKANIEDMLLNTSERLQEEEKDNYAVNASLRIFKALFQMIIKKHNLNMLNPCMGIDLFSVIKRMKYIPSFSEIKKVRELCDEEQKLLLDFVMETGARINEVLNVIGKDLGRGYVILYTRKSKNSNLVPRKVPLKLKLPKIKENEKLFYRWGKHPKFIEKKVRRLKQKPWSWHNLRHRYASLLSKKKKPLFEIMVLLGHSQLSTTQNYLQLLS